jgi:hypothetical protein
MPYSLEKDLPKVVARLAEVYAAEGSQSLASLLRSARLELRETGYDNWNGGTYTYALTLHSQASLLSGIIRQAEKTEEELLERLKLLTRTYENEHLESVMILPELEPDPTAAPVMRGEEPSFWKIGSFRLFISHASQQMTQASSLALALEEYGFSAFVAHKHIEPTKEWPGEILLALNTMDAFAAFLTPDFKKSDWTDQEVGVAVGRNVLIIPVRLGLDPYGFIGKHQGFQGATKPVEELAAELVTLLAKHQQTRQKVAQSIVSAFGSSCSFAEARLRVQRLDLIQEFSDPLVQQVRQAASDNRQIRNAWGVPERVEQIIKQRSGVSAITS